VKCNVYVERVAGEFARWGWDGEEEEEEEGEKVAGRRELDAKGR